MPLFLLKDKPLLRDIQDLGMNLEKDLAAIVNRSTTSNPQVLFKSFKDTITKYIREQAKVAVPKMNEKIRVLKVQLMEVLRDPNLDNEGQCTTAGMLEERIAKLESDRHQKT